jgi:tetratricopeptide (TPR) repeat protein
MAPGIVADDRASGGGEDGAARNQNPPRVVPDRSAIKEHPAGLEDVDPIAVRVLDRRGIQRENALRQHVLARRSLDYQVVAGGGGATAHQQRIHTTGNHQIIERYARAADAQNRIARRVCEIAGQIEEAVTLLDEALHIVERTGERWFAAELNRDKGRLLLRQGRREAAEELYRKALSIAREQEAKLWELRAAMSLARLWRDQGCDAEARELLAPVYGWFSEGFATPDLKEAKTLLDALA